MELIGKKKIVEVKERERKRERERERERECSPNFLVSNTAKINI